MSVSRSQLNKLRGEFLLMKENDPGLKPNFSALARETGISRQTIAKIWNDPIAPSKPRQKRKSKFDPYYEAIRDKFENNAVTMMGIFKYFQAKYPEVFTSYNSFKSYVHANKLLEARQIKHKAQCRYETPPGDEVQVDWKESMKFTLKNGEEIVFNIFTAVFGYSRYVKLIYSRTKTTEDFLRCMSELLKSTGGLPKKFKTDNMSAIVDASGKRKRKYPVIRQFEKDIDTPINLCKVLNPQSKGKVESANRFIQWLEPYQGELNSEEELMETIALINRQVNQESSRTTGVPRNVLMKTEKEHLRPLTRIPLLESYLKDVDTQTVPSTLLVSYQGHGYSVPKKFIGKRVKLIRSGDEVQIYYNNELICTHSVSEKPMNYRPSDYTEGLKDSISRQKDESEEDYEDRIRRKARESMEMMDRLGGKNR